MLWEQQSPIAFRMAEGSSEYGTFELLYELPMSAVSVGVSLGTGVGRGLGVGTEPFAATALMAKMRTANTALTNFVSVFICFFLSSFSYEICRPKFWNFFRNRKNFQCGARLSGGVQCAQFNKPPPPHKH